MASPQVENGFTRIANELLEAIVRAPLNGTQLAIVLHIIRETYGYKRLEKPMPLVQIAEATGRNKSTVSKEIKMLIHLNIVIEVDSATFNQARVLSVNKDYDGWRVDLNATVDQNATVEESSTQQLTKMQPPSLYRKERLKKGRFTPPTLDEVAVYGAEIGLSRQQCSAFIDHHAAAGWRLKAGPMKDWRAALRTWKTRADEYAKKNGTAGRDRILPNLTTGELG